MKRKRTGAFLSALPSNQTVRDDKVAGSAEQISLSYLTFVSLHPSLHTSTYPSTTLAFSRSPSPTCTGEMFPFASHHHHHQQRQGSFAEQYRCYSMKAFAGRLSDRFDTVNHGGKSEFTYAVTEDHLDVVSLFHTNNPRIIPDSHIHPRPLTHSLSSRLPVFLPPSALAKLGIEQVHESFLFCSLLAYC